MQGGLSTLKLAIAYRSAWRIPRAGKVGQERWRNPAAGKMVRIPQRVLKGMWYV